jgi:hypothetical protein
MLGSSTSSHFGIVSHTCSFAFTSGGAWTGVRCCAEAEEIDRIAQQKTRQKVRVCILSTSEIATDHITSIRKLAADGTDDQIRAIPQSAANEHTRPVAGMIVAAQVRGK